MEEREAVEVPRLEVVEARRSEGDQVAAHSRAAVAAARPAVAVAVAVE